LPEDQLQIFANRLRKRAKHLKKWAKRTKVSCYRVYDRDIPGIPLIVDLYEKCAHVSLFSPEIQEGDPGPGLEEDALRAVVSEVLSVPIAEVFLKSRQRQRDGAQYERVGGLGFVLNASEGGLEFQLNLSDYLDTGLFLDHRNTRARIRAEAKGKRVLNLFAYTGSFSVYAAAGGAVHTTTVDMSKTYLEWARQNMVLNGFTGTEHHFIRDDVFRFLKDPRRLRENYELIILDPPTYSRSKRMQHTLDVQRDHVDLLNRCTSLLTSDGVLYFSTNFRKFRLQEESLDSDKIEELTPASIPEDFRNRRIHRCWRILAP
jgi:23S rRNA (cytosine1962-C5)-methyltransferase